MRNIKGRQNAQ